ncbi:MAG TPA: response regulator [Candidatus Sulfomarinibacteraceae bacterium]|nr:response regulator [Candidatus Sulfomarinibacteraceae bacterium]
MADTKHKIFIVEDDVEVADMLMAFFSSQGYETGTASWGEEAVRLIRKDLPDVVLLDIRLPDIDGYEVCSLLRQSRRTRHLPIIFLTERRERKDKLAGLELGAVDYITKPFDIQELRLRVRNALQRANLQGMHNPITGLPEGPLVEEQIETLLQGPAWGLVFASIRGLDRFRDQYGFVAADDVTRAVSLMLANAVKENGEPDAFIGHTSGEEFVILTNAGRCKKLAERCRVRLDPSVQYFYPAMERERVNELPQSERLDIRVASLSAEDGEFKSLSDVGEALHTLTL